MRVSLWAAVSRYTRRNTVNCVTMSTFHCLRTNLLQLTERAVLTAMRTNDDGGGTLLQFFNMYINRSNKMIFLRFCRNISPSNTHPWLLHCIYFIQTFPINVIANQNSKMNITFHHSFYDHQKRMEYIFFIYSQISSINILS